MAENPQPTYLAYLIRLWREDENTWRATLEDPHTGERQAFAHVDTLLVYIKQQTVCSGKADDSVDNL